MQRCPPSPDQSGVAVGSTSLPTFDSFHSLLHPPSSINIADMNHPIKQPLSRSLAASPDMPPRAPSEALRSDIAKLADDMSPRSLAVL